MSAPPQWATSKKVWRPPLDILTDWLTIFGAISIAKSSHSAWVTAVAYIIIGARQHALFILTHEGVHGHLAPNRRLNEFLSNFLCAYPMLFDTEAYRRNHLKHHRHLNTEQDPDWVRKVGQPEWTFPVSNRQILKFLPFFLCFRGPKEWATIIWKFSGFDQKTMWKERPGYLITKLIFFAATLTMVIQLGVLQDFAIYWLVPLFLVFPLIQRHRSIAEHFGVSYANELNSTRDVAASWLEGFLFAPHNVNYHLTHHLHPQIPGYHLPAAYQHLCQTKRFAEEAHINESYILPYGKSVLRDLHQSNRAQSQSETVPKIAKSA